ncbi:MAG: zinc ribbon domain-containing protein [Oscillospiraceae bacterium]|nr:zinc ribbon domain-containing protein [Oscillospiraceae bacterium]
MFCTNCGKEIIDTAKFCNFCGMPVKNIAAAPVQPAPAPVQPTPEPEPVRIESETVPEPAASEEVTNVEMTETEETIPEASSEENTEPTAEAPEEPAEPVTETERPSDSVFPRPNTIPTSGESTLAYPAPPSYPSAPVPVVPVHSAISEAKPERKYTFGHIMMCLGAVAVMAIVAGVFAGLYFSVV